MVAPGRSTGSIASSWRRKSNTISNAVVPYGISDVVRPREFTYRVMFHQWLTRGARARRTLPTTWVQRCTVSRVSSHSDNGSAGHDERPDTPAVASSITLHGHGSRPGPHPSHRVLGSLRRMSPLDPA